MKKILVLIFICFLSAGFLYYNVSKKQDVEDLYSHDKTITNARQKLNLKSVYGDNEAYHPSVLYFENKWNGYKYWLAYTPFPDDPTDDRNGNAFYENPHVKASNDLLNWETPSFMKNPLDEVQGENAGIDFYNSDAELVYNDDLNRIECFWRYYSTDEIVLYMKYLTADKTWSDKQEIYRVKTRENKFLSPSILYEKGIYKMWYINRYTVIYEEYDSIPFTKAKDKMIYSIEYSHEKIYPWHLDIIKNNNKYEMIYVGTSQTGELKYMSLYYTYSYDNVSYKTPVRILDPSEEDTSWDNRGIYRSSMFVKDNKYYLFYSGSNRDNIKGIGIIYGDSIYNLYSLF